MSRRLPIVGLALLLALLIALLLTGAVREVVVEPLLYLFWVANLLYQMLPQALLWGLFLALAAISIGRRLFQSQPVAALPATALAMPDRVARWVRIIRRAAGDDYERWSLAQQLARLATEVLAHEAQCSTQAMLQRLERGAVDLPPEVRDYFRAGLAAYAPATMPARSFWQALLGVGAASAQPAPFDRDPTPAIEYLEAALHHSTGEAQ